MPSTFQDSIAPLALPMRTLKPSPDAVTAVSLSSSRTTARPATFANGAGCGSAGTTIWSRATT